MIMMQFVEKDTPHLLARLNRLILLALLASFVIGVAYFASAKLDSAQLDSSSAIPEVADFVRDFEDLDDSDPFLMATALLKAPLCLDWQVVRSTATSHAAFSRLYYRAQPRSPPFLF